MRRKPLVVLRRVAPKMGAAVLGSDCRLVAARVPMKEEAQRRYSAVQIP
jgi:hypothetical protein